MLGVFYSAVSGRWFCRITSNRTERGCYDLVRAFLKTCWSLLHFHYLKQNKVSHQLIYFQMISSNGFPEVIASLISRKYSRRPLHIPFKEILKCVSLVFHNILICKFQKLAGIICENFMLMKFQKLKPWNCLCERRKGSFCISPWSWLSTFKRRCFLTWRWWLHRDSHPDILGLGSCHSVRLERKSLLMLTLKSVYSLHAFWIYYKYLSTHLSYGYTNNSSADDFLHLDISGLGFSPMLHFCH